MSPPSSSDDARRAPRVSCVLRLHYRSAEHLLVSYCTNLSTGGLFVPTRHPLPVGTQIALAIDLPGTGQSRSVPATVRWTRTADAEDGPAGMGLSFEGVDEALGRYVDGLMARFRPLEILILSAPGGAGELLTAHAQALVTCHVAARAPREVDLPDLSNCDLVFVDVDSVGEAGLSLLHELSLRGDPPPRIALVARNDAVRTARAEPLARVVPTPVDQDELRAAILDELAQARITAERP